jgi:hypothetical protein
MLAGSNIYHPTTVLTGFDSQGYPEFADAKCVNGTELPVFVLTGYAQSGKSESSRYVRSKGWRTVATGDIVYDVAARIVSSLIKELTYDEAMKLLRAKKYLWDFDLHLTGPEDVDSLATCYDLDDRQFKIKVAEEIIVPVFGREGIVSAAWKNVTSQEGHTPILIESIGGEEYDILCNLLNNSRSVYHAATICIRRDSELPGGS